MSRHEYDWPNLSNLNFFIFEFLSPNKNQKDPAISSDTITDYRNLKLELQKSLQFILLSFNPLSANPTKWSNTLKQFFGKLLTNCLNVFDHFVGLALKRVNIDFSPSFLTYFQHHYIHYIWYPKSLFLNILTNFGKPAYSWPYLTKNTSQFPILLNV